MKGLRTWKLWSGLVVLFLAGVVVGAVGTGLYGRHKLDRIVTGGHQAMKEHILSKLTTELNLTQNQREQLEDIVCLAQKKLLELRRQQHPQVEAIIAQGIDSMKAHLSPDQQQKLDVLNKQAKERWEKGGKQPFGQRNEFPCR